MKPRCIVDTRVYAPDAGTAGCECFSGKTLSDCRRGDEGGRGGNETGNGAAGRKRDPEAYTRGIRPQVRRRGDLTTKLSR